MAFHLALINFTPFTWTRVGQASLAGVDTWRFPNTLQSGTTYDAQIVLDTSSGSDPSSAKASWAFTATDASHPVANLSLLVPNGDAQTITIKTEYLGNGFTVNMNLEHEQWSPFILFGELDHLYGNTLPAAWMAANLPYIGCLTLKDLIIPGSHDAGMSEVNQGFLGLPYNAQTQSFNIYSQLLSGARYFDIRPVRAGGHYATGHYSANLNGKQVGANGQLISDIIANINRFTSTNNELIILELSHSLNTDEDEYRTFNDAEWNSVLFQFYNNTKHLYTGHGKDILTTVPLSDFISGGPAVVVLTNERNTSWLEERRFLNRGFYSSRPESNQFPKFDSYSETDDLDKMRKDQFDKLVKQNANPSEKNQVHLLSWTLTQSIDDLLKPNNGRSIRDLAKIANNRLAEVGSNVPYTGPVMWAKDTKPPNIILIDDIPQNQHLASMALGLTRFLHKSCS